MQTPQAAATRAATVKMLNVGTAPPPVPQVSTSVAGVSASSLIIERTARFVRRAAVPHCQTPHCGT
jgi:hypothetical protein